MLHQSDEAILSDESFINYCLGRNEADIKRWARIIRANPGEAAHLDELRSIVLLTSRDVLDIELKHQIAVLEEKIALAEGAVNEMPDPLFRSRAGSWKLTVAACLVFLAGIAIFVVVSSNERPEILPQHYVTKPAEKKSLILPDGSRIILNADSKVTLHTDFGKDDRRVTLDGEAFFDVTHNPSKPFIVETPRMDIKVLGTAFNVKAYHSDHLFETSLIRGSVELTLKKESKTILLRPNQKYVLYDQQPPITKTVNNHHTSEMYSKAGLLPVKVDHIDTSVVEVAWTKNTIAFMDEPLGDVVKLLERWYGVRIVLEDKTLASYLYTGSFRNESLEDVLSALQFSKPFQIKNQGNVITIYQ